MAKNVYCGIASKARKIKKGFLGINNTARKIKKTYVGINDKAKGTYEENTFKPLTTDLTLSTVRKYSVPARSGDYVLFGGQGWRTTKCDGGSTKIDAFSSSNLTVSRLPDFRDGKGAFPTTSINTGCILGTGLGGSTTTDIYSYIYNTSLVVTRNTTFAGRSECNGGQGGSFRNGTIGILGGGYHRTYTYTSNTGKKTVHKAETDPYANFINTSFTRAGSIYKETVAEGYLGSYGIATNTSMAVFAGGFKCKYVNSSTDDYGTSSNVISCNSSFTKSDLVDLPAAGSSIPSVSTDRYAFFVQNESISVVYNTSGIRSTLTYIPSYRVTIPYTCFDYNNNAIFFYKGYLYTYNQSLIQSVSKSIGSAFTTMYPGNDKLFATGLTTTSVRVFQIN